MSVEAVVTGIEALRMAFRAWQALADSQGLSPEEQDELLDEERMKFRKNDPMFMPDAAERSKE